MAFAVSRAVGRVFLLNQSMITVLSWKMGRSLIAEVWGSEACQVCMGLPACPLEEFLELCKNCIDVPGFLIEEFLGNLGRT